MLFPTHATCTGCTLHTTCKSVGLPTIHIPDSLPPSSTTPALIFIGRTPSIADDIASRPYSDDTGIVFGTHDEGIYLDTYPLRSLASIYATNIVRCYAPPTYTLSPTRHGAPCSPHTLSDLATLLTTHANAPLILCSLGAESAAFTARYIFHTPKPYPTLATLFSSPLSTHTIPSHPTRPIHWMATYHPAYYLRDPNILPTIEDHLHHLHAFLTGTLLSPSPPTLTPPGPPP